ncbi:MAG: hypothetical protein HQK49_02740 [Oligoflexia bacterium]|nr:hypothetical protein [Oligoflexia bacterium]
METINFNFKFKLFFILSFFFSAMLFDIALADNRNPIRPIITRPIVTPPVVTRPVITNPVVIRPHIPNIIPNLIDINKCKNDKGYYDSLNKTSTGGKNQCAEAFKNEKDKMVKDGKLKIKNGLKPNAYFESTYAVKSDGDPNAPTLSSQKVGPIAYKPLGPDTYNGFVKKKKTILNGRTIYTPNIIRHENKGTSVSGFIGLPVGINIASAAKFSNDLLGFTNILLIDPSLLIHLNWEKNGNVVESCQEYAYERNHEYNNLDKQAMAKEDFREVVELFKHKRNESESENGIFHARDGSKSLSFDEMAWKVEDYMISLGQDDDDSNDVLNVPPNRFYDILDNKKLAAVNPGAVITVGLSPYTYKNLPPTKHSYELHTLKWHFQMAERLKGQADEFLDEMDRLQDRFEDLLKVRASISDQLFVAFQPYVKCYVPVWEKGEVPVAYDEKSRLHLPDKGDPIDFFEDPARGITKPIDFNLFTGNKHKIDRNKLPSNFDFSILDKLITAEVVAINEKDKVIGANTPISKVPMFNKLIGMNVGRMSRISMPSMPSMPSIPGTSGTTTVMSYSSGSDHIYSTQMPYWYFSNFKMVGVPQVVFLTFAKDGPYHLSNQCYYSLNNVKKMAADAKPILDRLKEVDASLDSILSRAEKEGCFPRDIRPGGLYPFHVPKCNWSPRMFARVMRNGFAKIQADDYRFCRNTTTSKFKANKIGRFAIGTNFCGASAGGSLSGFDSCIDGKWIENLTKSTSKFDAYVTLWKKAKEQIEKDKRLARSMIFQHDEKGKVLGTRRSTSPSVGDSFFGGSATLYGEMYTRFDDLNNVKSNQVAMKSGMKADVKILGESISIADISYGIETQGNDRIHPTRTGMVLGDNNIWTDSLPADGTGTFSYVTNNGIEASKESPHVYFVIPVLGFANIVIDAYGVASAELALNLVGNVDGTSRVKQNSTDIYSAVEGAQSIISPQAGVDAFVTAGLSIGIAEIGVKGSLNLIHVELPLSFSTTWDRNYYSLNGSLDLVLGTLSGRVSGYVELPWPAGDLEATLFSWNGVRTRNNLWKSGAQLAFMSVQDAMLNIEAEEDEDLDKQE